MIETNTKIFLVMDYCQGGTLKDFIQWRVNKSDYFKYDESRIIMEGIL
jgi:serine/threonine protein kinase